jgi:hypothetical protein
MPAKEDEREDANWWERIARGLVVDFATTIAALYAVGLLIVNLDLGRYGVATTDLARPEYVMVGLLWAILVTLTTFAIWFTVWFVPEVMRPIPSSRYFEAKVWASLLSVSLGVLIVLSLYILVLMIVCGVREPNDIFHPWFLNLVIGLLMQAIPILLEGWNLKNVKSLIIGKSKSILVPAPPLRETSESTRILALYGAIGTSVAFALLGLFAYTRLVFPRIPREWGGGGKPVVELFLTEKLPVFANVKDIPSTADGRRIGPVICILETDRIVVIASLNLPNQPNKDREAIAVDRKVVTAVVYEGLSSGFADSDVNWFSSEFSLYQPPRYWPASTPSVASPSPTASPPLGHQTYPRRLPRSAGQ